MTVSNDSKSILPLPVPVPKVEMNKALAAEKGNEKLFEKLDDNSDGQLSQDELVNGAKGLKGKVSELKLEEFDKNGDGSLSLKEFHQGRQAEREALRHTARQRVDEAEFGLRDGNQDGVLSEGEIGQKRLDRYDANGDGELTQKEFSKGKLKEWEESRHQAAKPAES